MKRIKPITRGMWSNWHKTKAKLTHTCLDKDLHSPNIVRGYRYVWHYYKYHTWLEKRRFDLYNATDVCMLFNPNNGNRDKYKAPRKF